MSVALILLIITLTMVFILRVPIALGMISASVVYFAVSGENVGIIAGKVLDIFYSNYTMMAVPLFIFTAKIMNSGQVTDIIFKFANGLVGRFKGGTGHVNILASIIFSGMTGSAIADASGLGLMEIEAMKKDGYDSGFSCALTAASATIGPIFPPSIPLIIYAMLSGASIGSLFIGGMIPGLLIGAFLMGYVSYISNKRNYPSGSKFAKGEFIKFTIKALPALLTPVILLGGIYSGVVTPTEAGAIVAFYSIIVSIFVYRAMDFPLLSKLFLWLLTRG